MAGHLPPQQLAERAGLQVIKRMAADEGHRILAGIAAEAVGIVRAAGLAIVVEIDARRHAGVRRPIEPVRIGDRLGPVLRVGQIPRQERPERIAVGRRLAVGVDRAGVVDLVEQQHIGPDALNDLCRRDELRMRPAAGGINRLQLVPVQLLHVERCDADRLGRRDERGTRQDCQHRQ
jgi:hypothetical protein